MIISILIFCIRAYTCLSAFFILFPTSRIGELWNSFLPYHLVLWGIGISLLVIFFLSHIRKKRLRNYINVLSFAKLFFFCVLFAETFAAWKEFLSFYEQPTVDTQDSWLHILVANIYKNNTHYEAILNAINQTNPDIVMMVEYSPAHDLHLTDLLLQNYPYMDRNAGTEEAIGNVVFSRYPLTNLIEKYPQNSRRYAYFQITYHETPYYIYLVHTSAPDKPSNYRMRDKQLSVLDSGVTLQAQDRPSDAKVIMVGDFNITPRDQAYIPFVTGLGLEDASRKLNGIFTRHFMQAPFFAAHIDHVFVSTHVAVSEVTPVPIEGSDHDGLLFDAY